MMGLQRFAVPIMLMASACAEPEQSSPQPVLPGCLELTALPPFIANDQEPVEQSLTLFNPCEGPVDILSLDVDDNVDFFRVDPPEAFVLGPGESTLATVRLIPVKRGKYAAFLSVRNSAGLPVEVEVTGEVLGPEVRINPVRVDDDAVPIGCTTSKALELTNVGEHTATVLDVRLTGHESWSIESALPTPFELPPQRTANITLQARPSAEEAINTTLTIVTQDPRLPDLAVPVGADAVSTETIEDLFAPVIERDVLFTVDRTPSVSALKDAITDAIPSMVSQARSEGISLHLAAVVGDNGCIVGGTDYIDETFSASQARSAIEVMLDWDQDLAPYGSSTEWSLQRLDAALDASKITPDGCNHEWYRPESEMHLVSVTTSWSSGFGWRDHASRYDALKTEGGGFRHHMIGSPAPDGCGRWTPATELTAFTTATGGVAAPICGDIQSAVDDVSSVAASFVPPSERQYPLSRAPVLSTLKVLVDGVAAAGWVYDEELGRLEFDAAALPSAPAVVKVQYTPDPGGDCP